MHVRICVYTYNINMQTWILDTINHLSAQITLKWSRTYSQEWLKYTKGRRLFLQSSQMNGFI